MSEGGNCPACGAPREGTSASGYCERCLLQAALGNREEEIHRDLLQITSVEERRLYVDEICSDAPELRTRVQTWLDSQQAGFAVSQQSSSDQTSRPDPPLIGGRYRLIQEIGEGGFGTVYLAEQTTPVRRKVALKILKLGMDTRQVVARFELERQTLALMDHPGIAKVLDAGATETGRPYFVMELVRGRPITAFCQEETLSIGERLALFEKVCQAVQHAHQKGIIHRDLKPSNILVATEAAQAAPKVIDFGIAKAIEADLGDRTLLTQEHQFLGTPAYISPEQADLTSADIDTRSDIYSLGVLLYELLTGSTPFDTKELLRSGLDEMRRTIREKEPLRPSTRLLQMSATGQSKIQNPKSKIDRDLDWIVLKCLQKDRALRYATANGLAMDIQRHLKSEPVVARPPTWTYRVSKLVGRNPLVCGLMGLLMLGFLLAGLGGAWMSLRLAKAKGETDEANRKLSSNVRYLESLEVEKLAADGHRTYPLAWLAHQMRQNPMDTVTASRALSMLSLHSFALPALAPFVHAGPVNTAEFSPDGTQVLTSGDDRTVRFWDTASGRQLRVLTNETSVAQAVYLAGGTRVLAVTRDNVARIFDASSGRLIFGTPPLQGGLWAALEDPEGPQLFTADADKSVKRWDVRSGKPFTPAIRVSGHIRLLQGSNAGHCLAVGCDDDTVHLLDVRTGQSLAPFHQFTNTLYSLQFTPDGRRLFVCLEEGRRVAIWNFQSTNAMTAFVPPARILANGMHFSPDGRRMVISCWAAPPRTLDAETLESVSETSAADTQGWDCAISRDGRLVAEFAQTGRARLCDLETGQPVLEPFAHQGWIRTVQFNSNNTQVLTSSQDGTARLWDVRMRQPPPLAFPKCEGGAETTFNHAGTRLLISVAVDAVQVCDAYTGQPVSPVLRHPAGGPTARIWTASFSHDDSRILTADNEGQLCFWNAGSFQIEQRIQVKRQLMFAKFSLDDRRIVVGDHQGCLTIWSSESGLQVGAIPDCNEEVVNLNLSPRGDSFVAAFANGTARCWTLSTGQPASPIFQHQGIVFDAAYSPDGKRVVTASADRTARVWDVQTGQPLLKRLQHEKEVLSACFSPDGKWILTTSQDGTARVWSALTGVPVSPLLRHAAEVWRGAFSPDSRWVATGSHDRTARLWDPQSGLPLSEPLLHPSYVVRLAFSADGHRLATFGGQSMLWDANVAPAPVPAWFCDLVEAVGGAKLEQDGVLHAVSADTIFVLRHRFALGQESDFYGRWAKWFLLDRMQDFPPPCPKS